MEHREETEICHYIIILCNYNYYIAGLVLVALVD